jgi:hypothetical protein
VLADRHLRKHVVVLHDVRRVLLEVRVVPAAKRSRFAIYVCYIITKKMDRTLFSNPKNPI